MMNKKSPAEKAVLLIILLGIFMAVIIPILFFLNIAFSSDAEISQPKKSLLPKFTVSVEVEAHNNGEYEIFYDNGEGYRSIITTKNSKKLENHFRRQYNVSKSGEELLADFSETTEGDRQKFTYWKDPTNNLKQFFAIVDKATPALINSIVVAMYTIIISLVLGSMAGYAMARYNFKFKNQINQSLLIVRMFPAVGISIPMALIMIKMGLFDTRIGLAILYSIPNIALTAWITAGIFVGISTELEEASLVFGANRIQTFMKITLPMAFPGLAASSMYAFLTAWNDTITALILTNENQTLALVVYKAIGTTSSAIQYAAAGSIILIVPALVFTFVVRKYINQMWGSVAI